MKRLFVLFLSGLSLSMFAQSNLSTAVSNLVQSQSSENQTSKSGSDEQADFGLRERILKALTVPKWDTIPSSYISAMESYKPTPGDIYQLTISSFDNGDASVKTVPFQLDTDYCFDLPVIGLFSVKGMDLFTLQKTVTHRLKTVLPVATVDFRLLTPALFDVFIYGKVPSPGKQIMNSTFHLVDSIAMVGGLTPTGSYRKVKVTGADGTERYFDISKYYTNADFSVNPNINPNDVIQILQADILVYASNALLYPGTYELIEGETIDAVIQQSGGFAGDENFIKASVLRKSGSTTETILVEAESFSEFKLQDKDIINFIPESLQYDPVIIDGAINIGSAPVSSQIADRAGLNEANLSGVTASLGTNRLYIPYKKGLTILGALDMAGGPTTVAKMEQAFILKKGSLEKTPLPNLKELWQTRNAELDVILEPGDKVIIPFEEVFVYVAGEVNDPKAIPYISSFALLDYVKLAGGFTLNANYKKYYLLDLEGKRIEVPKDYAVSPGDIIYIERNFAQLSNQAFKDVLIYTSFASSLVATASSIMSLAINIRNWQRN